MRHLAYLIRNCSHLSTLPTDLVQISSFSIWLLIQLAAIWLVAFQLFLLSFLADHHFNIRAKRRRNEMRHCRSRQLSSPSLSLSLVSPALRNPNNWCSCDGDFSLNFKNSEMVIKLETTTDVSSAAMACGNCGLEERILLHHVRHRGNFRRLCTTCVLRLNAQSFCPTCFQVYPPIPSNDAVINCCKCYSSSHSHCVSEGSTSPPTPYVCPLCTNLNIPIFKLKTAKEANVEFNEGNEDFQVIDKDAAKKLLAAAKIASTSMNKAVVAAKSEAERRVKEATFARKRAKEALEHVAYLVVKEKLSKKEAALSVSGGLSGLGAGGVGVSSLGNEGAKVKRENNMNVTLSDRNGNVGTTVDSLVIKEERIVDSKRNVDEIDNSTQVLAALNAVELKENEKISRISAHVELGAPVNDDRVVMDVDEKAITREVAGENVAELMLEGDNCDIETAISEDLGCDEEDHNTQGDEQEEVNHGDVLFQPIADQMESMENGNCGQQHDNGNQL